MLGSVSHIVVYAPLEMKFKGNEEMYEYCENEYESLIEQIKESENTLIAVNYRVNKMKEKVLKELENNIVEQKAIRKLKYFFQKWVEVTKIAKIQSNIIKKSFYIKLKKHMEDKKKCEMIKILEMTADNCYERSLKKKVYFEWKFEVQNHKKQIAVQEVNRRNCLKSFIQIIDVIRADKYANELSISIFKEKLLKRYFSAWKEGKNVICLETYLLKKNSGMFFRRLISLYEEETTKYRVYYEKKKLCVSFNSLKENKNTSKASKFYHRRTLSKYFNIWISERHKLFYEKEEEMKNDRTVEKHLIRKSKILLLYCFNKWHQIIEQQIENRQRLKIAEEYGEVREKENLLTICFDAIKSYKFYVLADNFHEKKLKSKVLQGLKEQIIKSSKKLDNLYQFVLKREKKRYFNAIQLYNEQSKKLVGRFRLQKAWDKYTFSIVKNYLESNKKAEKFHHQNLKFKTLFGFKEVISLRNKTHKAIILLNANMPIRRWRKSYKVRQFRETRNFLILAKVFRYLKLRLLLQNNE